MAVRGVPCFDRAIENLYRGRLFTTDINFYKGVIKINNNDFQPVIDSAIGAKGFKNGKICDSVEIGYDYDKSIELIDNKLSTNLYKNIVVIGLKEPTDTLKEYYDKIFKHLNEETLIISFSYKLESDNFVHFNTCFDSYAVVRICRYLLKYNLPLNIFLSKCARNTVAEMIYFKDFSNVEIFLGQCEPFLVFF